MSLLSAKRESAIDLREPTSIFQFLVDGIGRSLGLTAEGRVPEQLAKYVNDPVGFAVEVLKETLTDDMKRLMESVRDFQITLAKSANAVGKTFGAKSTGIWWFLTRPGAQVYTTSAPPEANLKRLLWGEIGSIVERHPALFEGMSISTMNIAKSALEFLTGVAIPTSGSEAQREAKFSGKHAPNLLFIVDESDAVPEEIFKGIESCMSGGNARLLMMFNPRAQVGFPYRVERDQRAHVVHFSAFNHPNVREGRDVIPGAVSRETTVRRLSEWTRRLLPEEAPNSEDFQLPSFLEGATAKSQSGQEYPPLQPGWRRITTPEFSYMVMGEYPAAPASALISREWITAARARWDAYVAQHGEVAPVGTTGIMGLDVSELGDDANAACFRYGGWVERIITWSGMDLPSTTERAVREYRFRRLLRCITDATGVGAGVAPTMKRAGVPAFGCKVASSPTEVTELGEFHLLRDQLWWNCREWLRTDPGATLPPDEALIEELLAPTYQVKNGKVRVMGKDDMREILRRSPDRADALCLTFYKPATLFPGL